MVYFNHNQAPPIHKPVVGEIKVFGENHAFMYETNEFTLVSYVTDYVLIDLSFSYSGEIFILDIHTHT